MWLITTAWEINQNQTSLLEEEDRGIHLLQKDHQGSRVVSLPHIPMQALQQKIIDKKDYHEEQQAVPLFSTCHAKNISVLFTLGNQVWDKCHAKMHFILQYVYVVLCVRIAFPTPEQQELCNIQLVE